MKNQKEDLDKLIKYMFKYKKVNPKDYGTHSLWGIILGGYFVSLKMIHPAILFIKLLGFIIFSIGIIYLVLAIKNAVNYKIKNRRSKVSDKIKKLNTKIWYRIIKVFYIFSFIFLIVITSILVIKEKKPYSKIVDGSMFIVCENGKKYNVKEYNFFNYHKNSTPAETKIRIKRLCYTGNLQKQINTNALVGRLAEGYTPVDERTQPILTDSQIEKMPVNYDIEYKKKTVGSWPETFASLLFWLFLIVIFYEIAKRTFYYIILGKIIP